MFTKLTYMERENKSLQKKVAEIQAKNGINEEVLDALLDKHEVADEAGAAVISLLRQKTVQLDEQLSRVEKERDALNA